MTSYADPSAAVRGYYQQYLGRAPQDVEVQNWLGTGKSLGEIEQGLAQHPLSKQGAAQINTYYQSSLGRAASAQEIQDWQGTGKSLDQIREGLAGYAQQNPGAVQTPTSAPVTASSGGSDKSDELLKSYQSSLLDFRQQLDRMQSDREKERNFFAEQLQAAKSSGGQAERLYSDQLDQARKAFESSLSSTRADLEAARTAAQTYQADADRFRQGNVDDQLQRLRSGGTVGGFVGGFAADGPASLAAGRRYASGSRGPVVQTEINAADSVLDRRGPVVETMSSGSRSARGSSRSQGRSAPVQGSAGSYYARRFG